MTFYRWVNTLAFALYLSGCHTDMADQPRYEPAEKSDFFDDGRTMRPTVEGTIARGQLQENAGYFTGKQDGELLRAMPMDPAGKFEQPLAVDRALLERGQQRFNIFCSNCHGRLGDGDGMIVRRGFSRPPTYHSARLRGVAVGHLYDVIANGYGAMPAYDKQISTRDRWAIVAYVRALQLSQYAAIDEVPSLLQTKLEGTAK